MQPVMIGRSEGFDAQEVFQRWRCPLAGGRILPERIIDPEIVAVAVDQDDRLLKCGRFLLQQRSQIGESARCFRLAWKRRNFRKHIGLLHDHDGAAVVGLGMSKSLPKPCHVGLVALIKLGVTFRGASEAIVAAWDMQRDERYATLVPSDIFSVFDESSVPALAKQWQCPLAEALLTLKENCSHLCEPLQWIKALDAL